MDVSLQMNGSTYKTLVPILLYIEPIMNDDVLEEDEEDELLESPFAKAAESIWSDANVRKRV